MNDYIGRRLQCGCHATEDDRGVLRVSAVYFLCQRGHAQFDTIPADFPVREAPSSLTGVVEPLTEEHDDDA